LFLLTLDNGVHIANQATTQVVPSNSWREKKIHDDVGARAELKKIHHTKAEEDRARTTSLAISYSPSDDLSSSRVFF
jgi:hypothetical protein